jgi:hypothetical protein
VSSTRPYYRRAMPSPTLGEAAFSADGRCVGFSEETAPPIGAADPVAYAAARFDDRAAAVMCAGAALDAKDDKGNPVPMRNRPPIKWVPEDGRLVPAPPWFEDRDLSEFKWYDGQPPIVFLLLSKCLPAMAYLDYFPDSKWTTIRPFVSSAVAAADTGWCGTFGPGVDSATDLLGDVFEGNYDMNQMHLVPLAYRYYQELSPSAREHLIGVVLAKGRIHRPNRPDQFTSGILPNDWSRAGFISPLGAHKDLGETENHILMMLTTRYLTNQLLYQRDHHITHDNRRNGGDDWPSCLSLVLALLRNILRGDFSEYNAKNYQAETRTALLNLCSYAYDHEVQLAARMVLDYISAHMAVSSNDLRRMIPFRRRNEGANVAHSPSGFMRVSLLGDPGADPMGPYFAIQAGNTRSCVTKVPFTSSFGTVPGQVTPGQVTAEATAWGLAGSQHELAIEALSDYRLTRSIHDLFVNDLHRRFFQRLHRTPHAGEVGGNRNCDNMEIYAASPSYLITAGGSPATYAIDPRFATFVVGKQAQQLGVAVTTSFMPTTLFAGTRLLMTRARDLIQFGSFSADPLPADAGKGAANYGVAPDFACGHQIELPAWAGVASGAPGFSFVNKGSVEVNGVRGPGFYLAIFQQFGFGLLEAFDTWLHPDVTFEQFKDSVPLRNPGMHLMSNLPARYTTTNGNEIEFVIWRHHEREGAQAGARVLKITYGSEDTQDALGDAGNITNRFLNGTILNSPSEAVVEVRNPALGTTVRLDLSDVWHPRRTDENGHVESAGNHEEVWLDFEWSGPSEGDVCRPFKTVAVASAAVASHGRIRVVPGTSQARGPIGLNKRFTIVAPIGGVKIGGV